MLSDRSLSVCPVRLSVCLWRWCIVAGWINMKLGKELGLGPCDIVLDGDWGPSSPPQKGEAQQPPLFDHVYCGQTAGWIKIPLGTEASAQATLC